MSYFFRSRPSNVWTFSSVLCHPDHSLTRGDVQFHNGPNAVSIPKVETARRVRDKFRASNRDQSKEGEVVSRFRTRLGQKYFKLNGIARKSLGAVI